MAEPSPGTALGSQIDPSRSGMHGGVSAFHFIRIPVRNGSGSDIAKGKLVYVSGWDSTHRRPKIDLADADDPTKQAVGVTDHVIKNGQNSYMMWESVIGGLSTGGTTVGDKVYLSATAGDFTFTAPSGSNQLVQVIGRVKKVSATAGQIHFTLWVGLEKVGSNFIQAGGTQPEDIGLDVRNETGGTLTEDTLVYLSSWSEANTRFLVAKADADLATAASRKALYVVPAGGIANATNGTVLKAKRSAADKDTSGTSVGDTIYLGTTAGVWTKVAPATAADRQVIVGRVAVVDATTGVIYFNVLDVVDEKFGTKEYQPLSVTSSIIAASAVSTSKLGSAVVTAPKIAASAVGTTKIDSLSVTTSKIAASAVTTAKIDSLSVTTSKIAASAVTTAKIDSLSVTTSKIAASAVTTAKIDSAAVTASKIAASAVGTTKIDSLSVTTSKIAASAVGTTKIDSLSVTTSKIAASAVTTAKLDSGAVTKAKVATTFLKATGTAVLATGSAIVSDAAAGLSTALQYVINHVSTPVTPGGLFVGVNSAGSFKIRSTSATDSSKVRWTIWDMT